MQSPRLATLTLVLSVGCASAPDHASAPNPRIDALFAAHTGPDTPGCAVALYRDGELAWTRCYGLADLAHGVPITPRTVFRTGSVSKQFTAACVHLLAEDGRLGLDDDIRTWLPELPDWGARVTVRHLVHHTGGLRDYIGPLYLAGFSSHDRTTPAQALAVLSRLRTLAYPPGQRFAYSNSGYFLLSQIVERASGQTLAAFAQARLFEPLGMHDTHFRTDDRDVVPHRAVGYASDGAGGFRRHETAWGQTGDGGVLTTVHDLAPWIRNLDTGHVGGKAFVRRMGQRGRQPNWQPLDYGFGLRHGTWRGLRTVGHGGAWVGYRAGLVRFPELGVTIACLANSSGLDASALVYSVAEIVLAEHLGPEPAKPAEKADPPPETRPSLPGPPDLARFAGRYDCRALDVAFVLQVRDGALIVVVRGEPRGPLRPIGEDRFATPGGRIEFDRDGSGQPIAFTLVRSGQAFAFVRL